VRGDSENVAIESACRKGQCSYAALEIPVGLFFVMGGVLMRRRCDACGLGAGFECEAIRRKPFSSAPTAHWHCSVGWLSTSTRPGSCPTVR